MHVRNKLDHFISYFLLIVISVFVAFPIVWMISTSLKTEPEIYSFPPKWIPQDFTLEWYEMVISSGLMRHVMNSFFVAAGSTILTLIFAVLASFAFARFKFRGATFLLIAILISQMLPQILFVIPLYQALTNLGLLNSYVPLMVTYVTFTLPLSIWILTGFVSNIPRELEEAAYIDGCGKMAALFRIILPLTLPGMAAVGIYSFLLAWSEFMFGLTFITDPSMATLPVALSFFVSEYQAKWGALMAGSLIATVPTVLIFIFLQKYFVKGLVEGAVKG